MKHSHFYTIAAIAVLIIIGLVSLNAFASRSFRVASTTPSTKSVSNISNFFRVDFNKPILSQSVEFSAEPDVVDSYFTKDKQLWFVLRPLDIGKTYTIKLKTVMTAGGDAIHDKTFTFTAKDIAFEKLPAEQKQAILDIQNQQDAKTKSDPILGYLPYGTLHFQLTPFMNEAKPGKSPVTIQAQLLLSNSDVNIDKNGAIAQYKQEVINYIKSLNLNPDNYTIDYEVVIPS